MNGKTSSNKIFNDTKSQTYNSPFIGERKGVVIVEGQTSVDTLEGIIFGLTNELVDFCKGQTRREDEHFDSLADRHSPRPVARGQSTFTARADIVLEQGIFNRKKLAGMMMFTAQSPAEQIE